MVISPGTPGKKANNSEEYDGTSWTEVNDLKQHLDIISWKGTQTAGLMLVVLYQHLEVQLKNMMDLLGLKEITKYCKKWLVEEFKQQLYNFGGYTITSCNVY